VPIDNYLLIDQEDEIRAAAARQREEMFAARAQAQLAPRPPEPWRHLSDATKAEVKATFAKWTAYQRGELGPPNHIQSLIDAQREADRQAYTRATNMGVAPRGMVPDTPVFHRSGLPEWARDVTTSLFFFPENGTLCPPGDWPTGVGGRPAMWNGSPFTRPFELPATWDQSRADFDLGRIVWRPGEHRWLVSPDAELPAP
jgi:hypothetical protein